MAINELSVGSLYVAGIKLSVFVCPVHTVDIIQMHEPWRRGRATALPVGFRRALVFGWWTKTLADDIGELDEDFKDDLWLQPHWIDRVSTDEISTWSDLSEGEEEKPGGLSGA